MKALKNHTIIYDDECPLCDAYIQAFIKTGMLQQAGREKFCKSYKDFPFLDSERARNEIALINKNDNTVFYGIQSLFKIIGHSFPLLRPVFNSKPFKYLAGKLYFFISYNRKVIVPGSVFEGEDSCTPSMHIGYRAAYIVFAWLATSYILFHYSELLSSYISSNTIYRELAICGGQIVFQALLVGYFQKNKIIHYLGNVMTVSLAGALLLSPIIFIEKYIASDTLFLIYFMTVVGLMYLEHARRVRILGLPSIISFSWVLYRLLVLMLILYPFK